MRTIFSSLFIILGTLGSLTVQSCRERSSDVADNRYVVETESSVVMFRFIECAGKWSVFALDNKKDQPIYAQVQRVDYWDEYRRANMELGVHYVEKVPPDVDEDGFSRSPWDAPPPMRAISPNSVVRYAVSIPKDGNRYRIQVPYLEDGDLAERLNQDFPSVLKNDFERLKSSWRYVYSDENTGQCQ